eukprot:scaffold4371_cov125-Isochrysis_galbana.AAC.5
MGRWPALGPLSRDKHDEILAPWAKGLRYLWCRRVDHARWGIKVRGLPNDYRHRDLRWQRSDCYCDCDCDSTHRDRGVSGRQLWIMAVGVEKKFSRILA